MENNSKCGICQTVFDKLVMLRKHVRVDHKLQYANHRCPHCRFGCYINTDLESHKVQKHPDLKQYHCDICNTGRVFFSESDYQVENKRFMKIVWIRFHHLHIQIIFKFKLLAGKFT